MLCRQKFVFYIIICIVLLGFIYFMHFKLRRPVLVPHFLRGASRFRASKVCAPLATILINSAPENTIRRQVIRDTWGHPSVTRPLDMTVAFGVGESEEEDVQVPVDWEAAAVGDVIQSLVADEYRSLPLKILSLLEKLKDACEVSPMFVIKTDDDVFVNVYALKDLLKSFHTEIFSLKLWCLVWEGMPVIRKNSSKWGISRDVFPRDYYPKYCSGSAYILNQRVLRSILRQHSSHLLLPFEDVYITGILAERAEVEHVQLGTRYAFESASEERVAEGQTIFAHLGPEAEERVEHFWNFLHWERKERQPSRGL